MAVVVSLRRGSHSGCRDGSQPPVPARGPCAWPTVAAATLASTSAGWLKVDIPGPSSHPSRCPRLDTDEN